MDEVSITRSESDVEMAETPDINLPRLRAYLFLYAAEKVGPKNLNEMFVELDDSGDIKSWRPSCEMPDGEAIKRIKSRYTEVEVAGAMRTLEYLDTRAEIMREPKLAFMMRLFEKNFTQMKHYGKNFCSDFREYYLTAQDFPDKMTDKDLGKTGWNYFG